MILELIFIILLLGNCMGFFITEDKLTKGIALAGTTLASIELLLIMRG